MKRLVTGFTIAFVAAVWMTGSWFFFNSIAVGAQGSATPAVADVSKGDPQDTGAFEGEMRTSLEASSLGSSRASSLVEETQFD